MNACGRASCRAFRWRPCHRPRTFWHCPKGSWTSQRLAFLWVVREACVRISRGFRWSPTASLVGPSAEGGLIPSWPTCFAGRYRVRDETRMNDLSIHYDSPQQDSRAGDLGAARFWVWASSPPSYVSAPPAHPVELRARRGRCRLALSARRINNGLVDHTPFGSHPQAGTQRASRTLGLA